MRTVSNKEQIDEMRGERALVTLFLDSGYSDRNIAAVMRSRWGFDNHVHDAWHLLIPYRHRYAVDAALSADEYDVAFARQIIEKQGIPFGKLPVLLFENYDGAKDSYYVSLAGMDEDQLHRTIGEIADIATRHHAEGRTDPAEFRMDVTEAVKIKMNKRGIVGFIRNSTPFIFASIGWGIDVSK